MTNRDLSLRLATAEDIGVIAHVVNTVSEGVVEALLGDSYPGKPPKTSWPGSSAGAWRPTCPKT